jgi:glucose-6-phosphate dehydrogenase assembly protein OpcA
MDGRGGGFSASMPEMQDLARGTPVEVSQINRSLSSLWEQEGHVLTRASLVNFAVYSEAPDALSSNTELMGRLTRDHACRVILLAANRAERKQRVQAWISAHCHLTGTGTKQVCSEQISFLVHGDSPDLIRNILFSHLDSDLPLYLWWQGEFANQIDLQLWRWVDRFFFDSQTWRRPAEQMKILRGSVASAGARCVLCDLNWRRLIYYRLALGQLFDHPWAARRVHAIRELTITYNPECWTTAVLFVSWVAAQLGWQLQKQSDSVYGSTSTKSEKPISVRLTALPGPWIGEIRLALEGGGLEVRKSHNFLEAKIACDFQLTQMLPLGGTTLADLMQEELTRGGEHRTYLAALRIAEKLWA